MLFQTPQFLVLLLAVMAGIVLLRTQTLQLVLILIASWIFYAAWEPRFLLLLLYCTVNDYIIGILIGAAQTAARRKFWLIVSLVTNLGVLAIFKYANFFWSSLSTAVAWAGLGELPQIAHIALPVGISFYTFHSLGYNIDVYRGKTTPERSFLKFAIYVAYFPQLVAGPILRAKQFLPQLRGVINLTPANLRSGSHLFLVGLFKKIVVADNVGPLADLVFASPQGIPTLGIWVATLCFGVQIYCDFSGYTDMARGVSRMFGLEIPINFAWPYFSRSITDFWRRWHISLSSWLRDYLYIPLGGNRHGTLNTYRNLMLTMALGGLWHGASWNFLIWGVYQGALLAIERFLGIGRTPEKPAPAEVAVTVQSSVAVGSAVPGAMQFVSGGSSRVRVLPLLWSLATWMICQYFVFLGWLLFRNEDFGRLLYCARKFVLFDFNFGLAGLGFGNVNPFLILIVLTMFALLHLISYRIGGIANRLDTLPAWPRRVVYVLSVAVLIALWPQTQTAFIYFQF